MLFGSKSSTSIDQRQWFDSYNVATNPTLAVSDLGKVTVQVNQPAPAGPVAGVLAGLDPRWLLTFGLLALVLTAFKPFR